MQPQNQDAANLFSNALKTFGAEKHLRMLQILVNARCQKSSEVLTKMKSEGYDDSFLPITIDNLKQSLEENNLLFSDTKELIGKIQEAVGNESWDVCKKLVYDLKKNTQILLLDIFELQRLLEEQMKQINKIPLGSDVYCSIAPTGSGKSTLTHYLAGSVLDKTKEGSFIVKEITNKDLYDVKVSQSTTSETQFISAVKIDLSKLDQFFDGQVILVDTPGLLDNRSPEIELSNQKGMIETLKRCNSLKPIFIFRDLDAGSRWDGLLNFLIWISKTFKSIESNVEAFTFLFNFKKNDESMIKQKLTDLFKRVQGGECNDPTVTQIIRYIGQNEIQIVDFSSKQPIKLWNQLTKKQKILNLEDNINLTLSQDVSKSLQLQCNAYIKCIETSISKGQFELPCQYIRNIQYLRDTFNENFLSNSLEEILKFAANYFKQTFTLLSSDLEKSIMNGMLQPQQLQDYLAHVEKMKTADMFIEQFLKDYQTPKSFDYDTKLREIQDDMVKELQTIRITEYEFVIKLCNLKVLSETIDPLQRSFNQVMNYINKEVLEMAREVNEKVNKLQFKECGEKFKVIKKVQRNLTQYKIEVNFDTQIEEIKDNIRQIFSDRVVSQAEEIIRNFNTPDAVEKLQDILKQIDDFREERSLSMDFQDLIKDIEEDIKKIYIDQFNRALDHAQEILKSDNPRKYQLLQEEFANLDRYMKIQRLMIYVCNSFEFLLNEVCAQIQKLSQDIERTITQFANNVEHKDYAQLERQARYIKQVQWIGNYRKGVFDLIQGALEDEMYAYLTRLFKKLREFIIDEENSNNIKLAIDILKETDEMEIIERLFPSIEKKREEMSKYFSQQFQSTLETIKSRLHQLDENKINEHLFISAYDFEQSIRFLRDCKNYCKGEHFLQAKSLNNQIEQFLKTYLGNVNQIVHSGLKFFQDIQEQSEGEFKRLQVSQESNKIYSRIEEFKKFIDKNYLQQPEFQISEKFVDYQNGFKKYYVNFEIRIEQEQEKLMQEGNKMKNYIHILQCLSDLDLILGIPQKFKEKYTEVSKKYNQAQGEAFNDLKELLARKQYKNIPEQIRFIKQNSPTTFLNAKQEVMVYVENELQNLKRLCDSFATHVSTDNLGDEPQAIVNQYELIDRIKQELQEVVPEINIREKQLQTLEIVFQKFNEIREDMKKELQGHRYNDADKLFRIVKKSTFNLKQIQDQTQRFVQINENLVEDIQSECNKVVKRIDQMQIQHYNLNPPIEIAVKLQACKDPQFSQIREQIMKCLNDKLKHEVKQLYSIENEVHQQQYKQTLTRCLEYIPNEVSSNIKYEIENFVEIQAATDQSYLNQIRETSKSDSFKGLKSLAEQFRQGNKQKYLNEVEKEIGNRLQDVKNHMLVKIERLEFDDQLVEGLLKLQDIADMGENFKKAQSEYNLVISTLKNKLFDYINSFALIFPFNDDIVMGKRDNHINEEIFKNVGYLISCLKHDNRLNIEFQKEINKFKECIEMLEDGIVQSYQRFKEFQDQQLANQIVGNQEKLKIIIIFSKINKGYLISIQQNKFLSFFLHNPDKFVEFNKDYESILKQQYLHLKEEFSKNNVSDQINKNYSAYERKQFFMSYLKSLNQLQSFAKLDPRVFSFIDHDTGKELEDIFQNEVLKITRKARDIIKEYKFEDGTETLLQLQNILGVFDALLSLQFDQQYLVRQQRVTVNEFLNQRLNNTIVNTIELDDLKSIAQNLLTLKRLSINIIQFQEFIDAKIDQILTSLCARWQEKQQNSQKFKLSAILEVQGEEGKSLLEHRHFNNIQQSLNFRKVQGQTNEYYMKYITGTGLDEDRAKERLNARAEELDKKINDIIANVSSQISRAQMNSQVTSVIDVIKKECQELLIKIQRSKCNAFRTNNFLDSVKKYFFKTQVDIIDVLSMVISYWSITNSAEFFEAGQNNPEEEKNEKSGQWMTKLHQGQILSLLRIFCCDDPSREMTSGMVQLKTGEGKSIVVAISATVFALLGADVHIACYSKYLNARDSSKFQNFFTELQVENKIRYGTFNQLSEVIINYNGNLRDKTKQLVESAQNQPVKADNGSVNPKIVIVDEFDTFFGPEFFGNQYVIQTKIQSPQINELFEFIWKNRKNLNLKNVLDSPQYKNVIQAHQQWKDLIGEQINSIMSDVKKFEYPEYVLENQQIGYKDQDGIDFNISYGYKTTFAYFNEYEKEKIQKESMMKYIGINICCGKFSYSDIPKNYEFIIGVSGTLASMTNFQKQIIKEQYQLNKETLIPSCYGENKQKVQEIMIKSQEEYYMCLAQNINDIRRSNQNIQNPIIIFFASKQKLYDFLHCKYMENLRDALEGQILIEELTYQEKEQRIKKSTRKGMITLATYSFGRGTDFICYDDLISPNGGVYIIVTFFPEEESELIQFMGRSARQGENGSFQLFLTLEELQKYDINSFQEPQENKNNLLDYLKMKRDKWLDVKQKDIFSNIKRLEEDHKKSMELKNAIDNGDVDKTQEMLKHFNKGTALSFNNSKVTRTLLCIDGTYSMDKLLSETKNTIQVMFDMIKEIFDKYDIDESVMELQVAIYRNYNCDKEQLLQVSSWENSAAELLQFLQRIEATGGWGNEAIEVALQYANVENQRQRIDEIFIIGDAGANENMKQVQYKRNDKGEKYWSKTKFAKATTYKDELEMLKQAGVKVNTLYLKERAQKNFSEMANETQGICSLLDIDSQEGGKMLTQQITQEILKSIEKQRNDLDGQLVKAFNDMSAQM